MEIEPPKFLCKHVPPMDFIVDQKMENKILLNHYLLERTMEIDPVTLWYMLASQLKIYWSTIAINQGESLIHETNHIEDVWASQTMVPLLQHVRSA